MSNSPYFFSYMQKKHLSEKKQSNLKKAAQTVRTELYNQMFPICVDFCPSLQRKASIFPRLSLWMAGERMHFSGDLLVMWRKWHFHSKPWLHFRTWELFPSVPWGDGNAFKSAQRIWVVLIIAHHWSETKVIYGAVWSYGPVQINRSVLCI